MAEHCAVNADVPVRLRLVTPIKGLWPRGKAADFYSVPRRFESCRAHQRIRCLICVFNLPRDFACGRRGADIQA